MQRRILFALVLTLASALCGGRLVFAESADELDAIQDQINQRKSSIEVINKRLEEYRSKINEYANKSASLQNDIALLENEAAMAELDVAATQNLIEAENLEMRILDERMRQATADLESQQSMLSELIFELNKQDSQGLLEVVFGAHHVQDVFSAAIELESVNEQLQKTVSATKNTREDLAVQQTRRQEKVDDLVALEDELAAKIENLEGRQAAKEIIAMESEESEGKYRVLMSELRREQQSVTSEIGALQREMQSKIDQSDSAGDGSVITWPLAKHDRITTLFYDPSYPFNHLFPHTGIDIAVPQGTPVMAAAPGYVAWARTGQIGGNYIVILHADGFSTYYGHLSRMDVVADQYITRGQVIGLSGGRPGTQGAGFSTGPHTHFEVRKDGIAVDPMKYLID